MIKKRYLFSPGPTPIPEKVLAIASEPIFHHRTPEFSKILHEVGEGLKYLFQTGEDVYSLTASGTGAMEAAIANLLSPGDHALVINAGKFGERWARIARAYGATVTEEIVDWGEDYPSEQLKRALDQNRRIKAVFCTLSETSTGALYDVRGFGRLLHKTDILLVVDGISGVGAVPCPMDEWNIDALITASQKSLMAPPGLAYVSLSRKAQSAAEKSTSPRFYFNLKSYRKNLEEDTTPFTPAISLLIQQHEALKLIRSLTLEGLIEHHRHLANATRAAVRAIGLELLARNPANGLTAVQTPKGLDGLRLVKTMQTKYMAHIASAQAPHQGEFFRIAHLGYMAGFDVLTVISALEMTLNEMGHKFDIGSGILAAQKTLQENWG
jgi:serine---pyruvate transaminase